MFKNLLLVAGGGAAVWWGTQTPEGRSLVSEFMDGLNGVSFSEISEWKCDDVADEVMNMELQNGFGARFEILKVSNVSETSRSDSRLDCRATLVTSNGVTNVSDIWVEDDDDAGYLIGAKQLGY